MQSKALSIEGISKTYSGICVLKDVTFTLNAGETHALVGENGAGKSTLIKIVSGVETPDAGGKIFVNGTEIHSMSPDKSTALGISVIYQDISLFPNLSVAENIVMGQYKRKVVSRKTIEQFAKKAFDDIGVDVKLSQKVGDLSVGQQQFVAIIRAISFKAKIIIMDEPTSALSSNEVKILFKIIARLKEIGVSVIYISHKLEEVFAVADRISVIRDGEIVDSKETSQFTTGSLISKMVGRDLRFLPMKKTQDSDEVIFEVRNLKNRFVNVPSIKIKKYEIVGLTGLVGAGRTELAQTIFGLLKSNTGEVFLHGEKIKLGDVSATIKSGIGYLPENRIAQGLFYRQNVIWNTTSASLARFSGITHYMNNRKELNETNELIQSLDVRPKNAQAVIESFSGGNQQKVLIGRWLSVYPKVLIADEPTNGVDVGAKLSIHKQLRELAEQGVAILLISSDLSEIMAMSDRVLVMRKGLIVSEILAEQATEEMVLKKGLMG